MSNEHIEIIRKACIAANPDLGRKEIIDFDKFVVERDNPRPIRLADVLLAIWPRDFGHYLTFNGEFVSRPDNLKQVQWNLRADDLTQQSPETLKFLADLLRV